MKLAVQPTCSQVIHKTFASHSFFIKYLHASENLDLILISLFYHAPIESCAAFACDSPWLRLKWSTEVTERLLLLLLLLLLKLLLLLLWEATRHASETGVRVHHTTTHARLLHAHASAQHRTRLHSPAHLHSAHLAESHARVLRLHSHAHTRVHAAHASAHGVHCLTVPERGVPVRHACESVESVEAVLVGLRLSRLAWATSSAVTGGPKVVQVKQR